jgi:hypothetical protein
MFIQRKPLNVITLGQRESDNINRMITISNRLLKHKALLLFIWDLLNLGQFDHINRTITISVITLSGLNCTFRGKLLSGVTVRKAHTPDIQVLNCFQHPPPPLFIFNANK